MALDQRLKAGQAQENPSSPEEVFGPQGPAAEDSSGNAPGPEEEDLPAEAEDYPEEPEDIPAEDEDIPAEPEEVPEEAEAEEFPEEPAGEEIPAEPADEETPAEPEKEIPAEPEKETPAEEPEAEETPAEPEKACSPDEAGTKTAEKAGVTEEAAQPEPERPESPGPQEHGQERRRPFLDMAGEKLLEKLSAVGVQIAEIQAKQKKAEALMSQYIRENANFQIQVREGMQSELDELRKERKGEQYNAILKEIAEMYAVYKPLLTGEENADKRERNIRSMFSQIEDLLDDYDAETFESKPGEPRQLRMTKIMKKIPTGNKELHDTIVRSIRPGVRKGKLVLAEEYVEIYVYDETLADAPQEN